MSESRKIRVFVVDDSAFMRTALERMFKEDPEIEIIGSAANGKEALEKLSRLKPDVVTMDVEMPVMDGLHALKEIMRTNPLPVIMVSSLTQQGARVTLDALDLGAVDYVGKPGSTLNLNILSLKQDLLNKIHAAAESLPKVPRLKMVPPTPVQRRSSPTTDQQIHLDRVVVIGASTGGPPAIQQILAALPANLPAPIIIAQHMPKSFTNAFAQRLNLLCNIRVKEAVDGETLQRSIAYICPGDMQTRFMRRPDNTFYFSIGSNEIEKERYAPCIDRVFFSAAECFGRRTVGVILTGMGEDGVRGLKNIKVVGGLTLAQDRLTSVVYGMPRAALEQGAVTRVLPLGELAGEIELALRT
ncbi:MAG: Chemotaxis response regulator protein-glutamate methylesterase CheB [Candidatus Ozemobacter sibiricus]|uniref:Protein-glutamate methylesterase/protein-glutamine glutaminase n=1 Tax=Candidatus Ozemobacter sibiricus TaxID=2268124 RepID=A0A367ZPS9_9BACT|nr:MAG: Chemotaxis response regulator protein-glutamate methylesterase CheB [Candidatus Ozemobacter sibiricus]